MSRLLSVRAAATAIGKGRLVIVPTETVYGLAANALDPDAVARIFEAKGRPQFNPIICHLPDAAAVFQYGRPSPAARRLAEFWPGPLTLLLPHEGRVPGIVTAGSPLAGFRVPDHPVTLELLQACQLPLAAPSANRSGRRSPTDVSMALADWSDAQAGAEQTIAGALDGGPCTVGIESTVIAIVQEADDRAALRILRPGGISREDLILRGFNIVEETISVPGELPSSDPGASAAGSSEPAGPLHAPGQLLQHYAPGLPLLVLQRGPDLDPAHEGPDLVESRTATGPAAARVLAVLQRMAPAGTPIWWLGYAGRRPPVPCDFSLDLSARGDLREAARKLFASFESIRDRGPAIVLAETVPNRDLGVAINDRLTRAASELISFA
jgi:L-threonylcarbamoyladenylate synthase